MGARPARPLTGRPDQVADRLGELRRRQLGAGVREPGLVPFLADEAEAAIVLGRTADAETVLGWLEERGRALDRASALATAARGRALLAGARGETELAVAACERALAEHARSPVPLRDGSYAARPRERCNAGPSSAPRRAKRSDGRSARFEELGAEPWAARARADLARIGGRRSSAGVLTPAERRVADLVAEGRSNKEIAATLFVTPKTVETQLSRMYRKLGVHSRTALARHLGKL